jgi:hypothetical protein
MIALQQRVGKGGDAQVRGDVGKNTNSLWEFEVIND